MHCLDRSLIACIAALVVAHPIRPAAEERAAPEPVAAAPAAVAPDAGGGAAAEPTTDAAATVLATVAAGSANANPRQTAGSGFAEADRLVVHKSKRRLELLKGGAVVAEYPIRLGLNPEGHKLYEGDFRTPEGHYYLSRRNPRSEYFLSIEVSYPNDWDRRRARGQGKAPGGSIMIHGQPNVPRKPADYYTRNDWTDGCIAVSNSDMVDIWLRTKVGLPIDIRP
jgi:hypothetical protein